MKDLQTFFVQGRQLRTRIGRRCGNCVYAADYHPMYCGDRAELWGTVKCKRQRKRVVEALGCDKRRRPDGLRDKTPTNSQLNN